MSWSKFQWSSRPGYWVIGENWGLPIQLEELWMNVAAQAFKIHDERHEEHRRIYCSMLDESYVIPFSDDLGHFSEFFRMKVWSVDHLTALLWSSRFFLISVHSKGLYLHRHGSYWNNWKVSLFRQKEFKREILLHRYGYLYKSSSPWEINLHLHETYNVFISLRISLSFFITAPCHNHAYRLLSNSSLIKSL